jgi:hypothetical protein
MRALNRAGPPRHDGSATAGIEPGLGSVAVADLTEIAARSATRRAEVSAVIVAQLAAEGGLAPFAIYLLSQPSAGAMQPSRCYGHKPRD